MAAPARWTLALLLLAAQFVPTAQGQQGVLPGDERPELPEIPAEPPPGPRLRLPKVPEAPPQERRRLSSGLRVDVQRFEVIGSTVFEPEELAVDGARFAMILSRASVNDCAGRVSREGRRASGHRAAG